MDSRKGASKRGDCEPVPLDLFGPPPPMGSPETGVVKKKAAGRQAGAVLLPLGKLAADRTKIGFIADESSPAQPRQPPFCISTSDAALLEFMRAPLNPPDESAPASGNIVLLTSWPACFDFAKKTEAAGASQ